MPNIILTPVTLWRDFDDSLPFEEEIVSERREGGAVHRELYFHGRPTREGRVKIFAKYAFPEGKESFPAVLVLFEAGFGFDERFVSLLLGQGYGVFCVDYCGENGTERHTRYPEDIAYANYVRAGDHLQFAEPSARETSWYEWAGVARYAARYLAERAEVTSIGAIGLRTGGEVLFKVAPYAKLSCFISVCAAGWLAYRGMDKFGDGEKRVFDDERHRFIAGIDSQSYAPYVKCPVLLLSAVNDRKYNYDRVYDTFRQINAEVEKGILFSAHGNGLIGSRSLRDLVLFLEKYLKGHSVYISRPIALETAEDEKGNLVARFTYDEQGEIEDFGVFFTEKITASQSRDWTCVLGERSNLSGGVATVPLDAYVGCEKMLVYAFAQYSNGFSVTSKIMEVTLKKQYANSRPKSRVVYSNRDGKNGFTAFSRRKSAIADCFSDGKTEGVRLLPGYGGIEGITSDSGLISYRVSEPRYEAPEGASFHFDAYSAKNATLKITFYMDTEEKVGYSEVVSVEGGGKWKSFLLSPSDFKSETGAPLPDFAKAVSLVFERDEETLINNVLWI